MDDIRVLNSLVDVEKTMPPSSYKLQNHSSKERESAIIIIV